MGTFSSASGLRPISAFVVIGVVVLGVALWLAWLSVERGAAQPRLLGRDVGTEPAYAIADREGRPLARFVPRFDLEMSPRSMWQAHTPRYMAERIAGVLGGALDADELLARMLPDARDGWIEVEALDLGPRQALGLGEWIEHGERVPLRGLRIARVANASAERFRLSWEPAELLSRALREECGVKGAWRWARHVADEIDAALRDPVPPEAGGVEESEQRREAVWTALLPSAFTRPLSGLPSAHILELRALLEAEGVATWQMRVAYARERSYPSGQDELFGSWGFADPDQTHPRPRAGLELLSDRLLSGDDWDFLRGEPEVYSWRRDRTVRGKRANGFLSYEPASAAPTVRSTLDLALQRQVEEQLELVMQEHRPALAMAIVLDLERGDVLALASREEYEVEPFAPVYHVFTPGSTLKAITMAVALEEGVVTPGSRFDVGPVDHYLLYPPGGGRPRRIHEAEGSLGGEISAAESLAWSVNAGLVQIGLRVPDTIFRDYLLQLGYGRVPGSGLGVEKAGYLAPLPWSWLYTHASISFGHEITTTLWQHAQALAALVRGGVCRPNRLLCSVDEENGRHELAPEQGFRVFSERTAQDVREMMRLGAREGTGASVLDRMLAGDVRADAARALSDGDVGFMTKTGTAEKVPTELCLHVELAARARWQAEGIPATRERLRALRELPKPHKSCYTSSMCAVGAEPGSGREVMVLVVADEPRGREKFGSRVAGPAAFAILSEALGLTRGGRIPAPALVAGFQSSALAEASGASSEPWRVVD